MDTLGTIKKDGYKRENLSKENQAQLDAQDYIINELDNLKNNLEFIDSDMCSEGLETENEFVVGKIKTEIAINVIDKAVEWLKVQQAEYQISLAENEEEEEK
jgi:hypothetical protein